MLYKQLKPNYAQEAFGWVTASCCGTHCGRRVALSLAPAHRGSIVNSFVVYHNHSEWHAARRVALRGQVGCCRPHSTHTIGCLQALGIFRSVDQLPVDLLPGVIMCVQCMHRSVSFVLQAR